MKKIELLYFTVAKNCVSTELLDTVDFSSTARNWHVEHVLHTFLCRADDVFLSSRWHFWKNCRAVEIRADAFQAVDPDSIFCLKNYHKLCEGSIVSRRTRLGCLISKRGKELDLNRVVGKTKRSLIVSVKSRASKT